MGNKGAAGLKCVSISADMKRFAAVDMSNDHNVYVFDCESGNQMYKQKGDGNKIYDITFSGVSGDYKMCTVGSKHCKFWDFGGSRDERRGIYGAKYTSLSSTTHLVCASDANGTFYTGGTNGSIFIWKDHALDCVVEAHKGGFISAMRIKDDMLYTGAMSASSETPSDPATSAGLTVDTLNSSPTASSRETTSSPSVDSTRPSCSGRNAER